MNNCWFTANFTSFYIAKLNYTAADHPDRELSDDFLNDQHIV